MKTKLWRLSAALILTIATFGAPLTVKASNPDTCTASGSTSFGVVWSRTATQVGSALSGVRALMVARALEPCIWNSPNSGKAFALTSYQGNIGGINNLAQVGLMKFSPENQTFFGWTPFAGTSGTIEKATWADFDGNGQMDTPVGGRSYLFDIQRSSYFAQGATYYQFRFGIKDTVLNVWKYGYHAYAGGYKGSGYWTGQAWWGCEAGPNSTSNIGSGNGTTARLYIQEAQYEKASDNAWYYTQNSTLDDQPFGWAALPSNQHYAQDDGGALASDRVWCWGT